MIDAASIAEWISIILGSFGGDLRLETVRAGVGRGGRYLRLQRNRETLRERNKAVGAECERAGDRAQARDCTLPGVVRDVQALWFLGSKHVRLGLCHHDHGTPAPRRPSCSGVRSNRDGGRHHHAHNDESQPPERATCRALRRL